MRLSLKSLLVLMALLAIAAAVFMANRRSSSPHYEGYLVRSNFTLDYIRKFDPNVRAGGGGGGGGGPAGQALWRIYKLTSTQPINEGYFDSIRNLLLEDLRNQGVRITMERNLHTPDREPNTHGFLRSWGYEVTVEDRGFKGLITIRLMPTPSMGAEDSGYEVSGHKGELHENIVVFRKD